MCDTCLLGDVADACRAESLAREHPHRRIEELLPPVGHGAAQHNPTPMPALDGTTVVDFTRQLPGPFASRELLRRGARVVKIEPPEGDPTPPELVPRR